jgi:hypothetical protein
LADHPGEGQLIESSASMNFDAFESEYDDLVADISTG